MSTPLFASLGPFIIDENIYPPSSGRESEYNLIGGGGPYAMVGGRIACGRAQSKRIGGIIDTGSDFPQEVRQELDTWEIGAVYKNDDSRLTTRGANVYGEDGVRHFFYRSPKKRVEAEELILANLGNSQSFHFCCGIGRCEESIDLFSSYAASLQLPTPRFLFEPFPDICVSENLNHLLSILPKVDVFTPNLNEAASFYSMKTLPSTSGEIEQLAERFFAHCPKNGGVVLRCGEKGCFVRTSTVSLMLPPYHQDQANVIDVTGGGNSFCGAFMTALVLSKDWIKAAIMGNIASGIVIEKLGMPTVTGEKWNGASVQSRLKQYLEINKDLFPDYTTSSFSEFG